MENERKKLSNVQKKFLFELSESRQKLLKYFKDDYRKNDVISDRQTNVVTDKELIYNHGLPAIGVHIDTKFKCIAYRRTHLADILGVKRERVTEWTTSRKIFPKPIFRAYVQNTGVHGSYYYEWADVYTYEEVLVISKYLAQYFKHSIKLDYSKPEIKLLNAELESVRDEIKRRIQNGETAMWSRES